MNDENIKKDNNVKVDSNVNVDDKKKVFNKFDKRGGSNNRRRDGKGGFHNKQKNKNLVDKVLKLSRVGKTNAGGKVISFSAFAVVGNKKGKIGLGLGKAKEVTDAIEKCKNSAQKDMIELSFKRLNKIPHPIKFKYRGTLVHIQKSNKGLVSCNLGKSIFRAAGLTNVTCKLRGARTTLNSAYGILECLKRIESIGDIAIRRGMTINDLLEKKNAVISLGRNQSLESSANVDSLNNFTDVDVDSSSELNSKESL